MDRLLASSSAAGDALLLRLADADLSCCRWRRRRRRAVEALLLAGVLCSAVARAALPRTGFETILFFVCGVTALWLAVVERRAQRRRERIASELPRELGA